MLLCTANASLIHHNVEAAIAYYRRVPQYGVRQIKMSVIAPWCAPRILHDEIPAAGGTCRRSSIIHITYQRNSMPTKQAQPSVQDIAGFSTACLCYEGIVDIAGSIESFKYGIGR